MAASGSRPVHVHIGAGAFGLGFVVPLASTRFESAVFARESDQSRMRVAALQQSGGYVVRTPAGDEPISIASAQIYDPSPHDQNLLVQAVADPRTILVTTAVNFANLSSVGPFLTAGLALRPSSAPALTIVPCENDANSAKFVAASLASATVPVPAVCLDASVDRICSRIVVTPQGLVVEAESFSEWVIEDGSTLAMSDLRGCSEVVTAGQLELRRIRKRWVLNGTDIVLALRAQELGRPLVADGLDRHGQVCAEALAALASIALSSLSRGDAQFDFQMTLQYHSGVLARIANGKNRADRVLRELVSDQKNSTKWLQKVNQRISEPVRQASAVLARAVSPFGPATAVHAGAVLASILMELERVFSPAPLP